MAQLLITIVCVCAGCIAAMFGRAKVEYPMKLVVAVIQPFKLEEVRNALTQIGVRGMTITEVEGFGNQRGHNETDRGAEYAVSFVPKVQIEVAAPTSLFHSVVDAIVRSARTGQIGDGKIFVTDIDHATRICTGETDDSAL